MKREPKSIQIAALVGLGVGFVLWVATTDFSQGVFQRLQIIVVPAALGIAIASLWNRRHKIGAYDPNNEKPRV